MGKEDLNIAVEQWLSNNISYDEFSNIVGKDQASLFKKITDEVDTFSVKKMDVDASYQKLKTTRDLPKGKQAFLSTRVVSMLAASVALIFGIFFLAFESSNTVIVSTAAGQDSLVKLPCGSEVLLSSLSTLEYDRDTWEETRKVKLKGRAYFDVEKGSSFSVSNQHSCVEVLGTTFEVLDQEDFARVFCYTGKVKVTFKNVDYTTTLLPLHGVECLGNEVLNFLSEDSKPAWIDGVLKYDNKPLSIVLQDLENEYNIHVDCNEKMSFTGVLPRNNQALAIEVLTSALQLTSQKEGDKYFLKAKN